MDKSWGRVGELFHAACALAVDEREPWVRSACSDDRISAEVLALLKAYEEDPAFLERPVPADVADALHAVTSQPVEGRRLGPYRLVREIGRGGMGIVYEALQTDGDFSRRVAIKLVPSGWTASSLTERFRYERRVLARLDHPGIARLLDAGTTDEGAPYFVMDLVDGLPIDFWCRERALTVRQRVELILRVSEAVEHAHRNLVVHRDLKASNILVAADGQPKLLDFGIAKFLSEEAESHGGLTGTGQQVFTPGYASPEQIRGEGATTATDVYSLGVLLYLLLTEQPPYDVAALSPLEAMRTVCEVEPRAPSSVAPIHWRRTLQGDLDNILLKALRKSPHERYRSVHAMGDDLRAWLDGRPVSASPATLWYRTRKLAARRKAAALAVAAVSLALAAGAAATAWQAHVARLERDKAESRFREVRVFSRSLLFELHDAIKGLPGSTSSRQLLLSRATEFLDGLAKDAGDDRALKVELAEGYRRLGHVQGSEFSENVGDVASAIGSFEKAVRLGEEVLAQAPRSSEGAIVLTGAYADLAAAKLTRGEIDPAEQAYRRQLAIVEQLERTNATEAGVLEALASNYNTLGYFRGVRKDYSGAKALYAKSISLHDALPPQRESEDSIRSHAFALKRLGALLVFEGSLDDGEARYRAALALDEQMIARHPDDARYRYDMTFSLNDLALIASKRGDSAGAESMWTRTLAIRQAALAADPKNARTISGIAYIRAALGNLYLSRKQVAEAIDEYREQVRLRDRLIEVSGSLPGRVKELADARVCLARALLDRAEGERGDRRADSVREAGRWLSLAEPVARKLEAQNDPEITTDVKQQADRLRRLGAR